MSSYAFDPKAGAKSLLEDAINVSSGQTLAIVAEEPSLGFYDTMISDCVSQVAESLGVSTKIIRVGDHTGLDDIPTEVDDALRDYDHVLFLARLGDSLRFSEIPGRASKTMSYALDVSMLGSPYCTLRHSVLKKIQNAYNTHADQAKTWRVTCPNGTDITGTQDVDLVGRGETDDFTVIRYPVCAARPIGCETANGVVALSRFLMASGNRRYPDSDFFMSEAVMAEVKDGKIVDFEGGAQVVADIRAHYERVGEFFQMDPFNVHSWHAGLNPGASYPVRAELNLDRWGMATFANPRYLHFHTCGDYAPGEIAWSLFDATAELGGEVFWKDGRLTFLETEQVKDILRDAGIDELPILTDIGID